jgi:uncharacterized protein (TIGR02186 family)
LLKKRLLWLILMVVAMISWPGAARSSDPVSLISEPDDIRIGALFSGAQVSVSGTIPAESEVMVQVTGKREDLLLKTKGRALGVLWMNLGSVTLHQVPALYLVYVSEAIGAFARSNPVKWQELGIGLESLTGQIEITSDRGDKDALRKEFLKLKQGERLYAMKVTSMRYGKREDGVRSFATEIFIPARVSPGIYQVRAVAVNDGHIVGAATGKIRVQEVGVPALLSSIAFNHGGLYGLLAVLIAIGAGLLMDFLFGDHQGSH